MIKFFRKIRQNVLSEGKTGKYLKYAVGEIVLVVIGILIALQINSWNEEYKLGKQEVKYLTEIKNNLLIDQQSVVNSINLNNRKIATIDSLMILLSNSDKSSDYMEYLASNTLLLTVFPTFEPVKVAFDNMISSHSIAIIKNEELRLNLSTYYNYNWERSPQSVSRIRTRKFADILIEKLVDNPIYHKNMLTQISTRLNENNHFHYNDSFKLDIDDPNYLEFHNDRMAISAMFSMVPTMVYQSSYIENAGEDINALLELIQDELEKGK